MRYRFFLALIAITCACVGTATAQVPPAAKQWAGSDEVVFYLDFEDGPYAWKATGNPYQLGAKFEIKEGGYAGRCWRNSSRVGYIAFDGRKNVPVQAGTVSMWVKSGPRNIFNDGRKHCLASLPRTTQGMTAEKKRWESEGLALSLRKTERNTIALIVHAGGDFWMRRSKPIMVLSADARGLAKERWHHLAFSWDFGTRKLWLAVDGKARQGAIPKVIRKPYEYLGIVFGNTENYLGGRQEPLDGMVDDIAILKVSYPHALKVFRSRKPYAGARPKPPVYRPKADLFPDDVDLARCERAARGHLDMLVKSQRHGGWCLAIKWPSHLQMTARYRLHQPHSLISLSKDSNSGFAAAQLLWAYQALGDKRYFEAAKKTAEMYLATQHREGCWSAGYWYEHGKYISATGPTALIQDHCQTAPMMFLAYMHRVTGDERYLKAAKKNAGFLMRVQNPNGSWSHHYNLEKQVALTSTRQAGGGEINDYGTSAPVKALLWMYRLTGEARYRQAALKGADWMVDVLIEDDKVVGWSGQYDAQNRPLPARHHEPRAVTQYAPRWAALGLFAAYRETRNGKYLAPLRKAIAWFDTQKKKGLWWDYDIESGRPIHMWRRRVYFMDDPEQVKAYRKVTGRNPKPRDAVRVDGLRNEVKAIVRKPWGNLYPKPTQQNLKRHVASAAGHYVKHYIDNDRLFNAEAGLYVWESQWGGLGANLVRHQVVRFCDLLMRARAARGDIPADNPVFRRSPAMVGWHKVMPAFDRRR